MKKFFEGIVERMATSSLLATQGGPIVLVQVENELPATDKTYVEWCGTMVHAALASVKVDVPVTMCNGETATTAINTQHVHRNDCADFLEKHGQNGRVLVDQPALWFGPRTRAASRRGAAHRRRGRALLLVPFHFRPG